MKKIEATIQRFKLEAVKNALIQVGVEGMTITELHSVDGEIRSIVYRGVTKRLDAIPRIHLETVVSDKKAEAIIDAILRTAQTGKDGDGTIVVSDVLSVTRIRTGETTTSDAELDREEKVKRETTSLPSRWDVPSYQHSW